jgi:hypothetical protein
MVACKTGNNRRRFAQGLIAAAANIFSGSKRAGLSVESARIDRRITAMAILYLMGHLTDCWRVLLAEVQPSRFSTE